MGDTVYVRYQGTTRSPHGHFPGVFALANGLARDGRLSEEERRFWRSANDWYDAAYPDPSDADPSVYDRRLHPGAVAWFKSTAVHLLERVPGYLALLAAHGVPCERVESAVPPGRIVYEDAWQVVVVPETDGPAGQGASAVPGSAPDRGVPAPAGSSARPDAPAGPSGTR